MTACNASINREETRRKPPSRFVEVDLTSFALISALKVEIVEPKTYEEA